MSTQFLIAVAIGLVASIEDLWHRNISNWIPLSALVAGFGFQASQHGWKGLLSAAAGTAVGFSVFLVFYLLGGMGGGDIKLMAGFGALIGVDRLLEAAMWTAILGAIAAVGVLGMHSLRKLWKKDRGDRPKAIPYAPAIAAGVLL